MSAPAAFVLAAGLGTRLRPLTDLLPKPLVPVFHKPLLTYALDSLITAGVGSLVLNTHHLPGAFAGVFGNEPGYRGRPLRIFHEPLLLDTGGGIRNARGALSESTFLLYNGDILADLPIDALLTRHRESGALATMLLRPAGTGGKANVLVDSGSGRILDIRGGLGVGHEEGELAVYCGIAAFEPAIFRWIPSEGPSSIIDCLLEAMRHGEKVEGMLCESGLWMDLGTPAAYLQAHHFLADPANRPSYITDPLWPRAVDPGARIGTGVSLEGMVSVGRGAMVGEGAVIRDSILWPGAVIAPGSRLEGCIVSGIAPVSGDLKGEVL
jgi:NDP-sugar pyrophosphorylase family protein